jgi:hypothetical protein
MRYAEGSRGRDERTVLGDRLQQHDPPLGQGDPTIIGLDPDLESRSHGP